MSREPSVEPLSATITSPAMPNTSSERCALRTQTSSVSASLRHGNTIDNSIVLVSVRGTAWFVRVMLSELLHCTGVTVHAPDAQAVRNSGWYLLSSDSGRIPDRLWRHPTTVRQTEQHRAGVNIPGHSTAMIKFLTTS